MLHCRSNALHWLSDALFEQLKYCNRQFVLDAAVVFTWARIIRVRYHRVCLEECRMLGHCVSVTIEPEGKSETSFDGNYRYVGDIVGLMAWALCSLNGAAMMCCVCAFT
jgi:hypothetical protein